MLLMYVGTVVSSTATASGWLVDVDVQCVIELQSDGEQFSASMQATVQWLVPEPVSGTVVVFTSERGVVLGISTMGLG